jgi:hypothetical protein
MLKLPNFMPPIPIPVPRVRELAVREVGFPEGGGVGDATDEGTVEEASDVNVRAGVD